jgi:hypothetical protein
LWLLLFVVIVVVAVVAVDAVVLVLVVVLLLEVSETLLPREAVSGSPRKTSFLTTALPGGCACPALVVVIHPLRWATYGGMRLLVGQLRQPPLPDGPLQGARTQR